MIQRFPKGELPEMAKVMKTLNGEIHAMPAVNKKGLIPRTIEVTQQTVRNVSKTVDNLLTIRVMQHHTLKALLVDLAGVLNAISARKLRDRIAYALERTKLDIILNFEHVQFATKRGLKGFLPPYHSRTHAKIKCSHVPSHFRQYLEKFHEEIQFIDLDEEVKRVRLDIEY
jgi:hypothetical protein